MKLKFKTIMTNDNRFIWDGYDDGPDYSDRPVLLQYDEADEYLKDLRAHIDEYVDVTFGDLRICDVEVEVKP